MEASRADSLEARGGGRPTRARNLPAKNDTGFRAICSGPLRDSSPMSLALIGLATVLLFGLAYRIYGGILAKRLALDDGRACPSSTLQDGVDYIPTPAFP